MDVVEEAVPSLNSASTITVTKTSTTANEENRQIIAHLEDDDGTPIGLHDQFAMKIYRDLNYNTFGYIVDSNLSFSSNPYEDYTHDRRPPTRCELINLKENACILMLGPIISK